MIFNDKYLKTGLLLIFCLCLKVMVSGQEVLTGLPQNTSLIKASKELKTKTRNQEYQAVKLPFFDDFSYESHYPDPELWKNNQGFVNNTYPIYPPTIGVVTLDALDEYGKIYSHASRSVFPADTLLSRPIRLDSLFTDTEQRPLRIRDSLYFSFYYQPGGGSTSWPPKEWERIGDRPESGDSLVLEFGYETGDTLFVGYHYVDYGVKGPYAPGDSIENPFIPGTFYHFVNEVYEGDSAWVRMPHDSIFEPGAVWNLVWSTGGVSLDQWLNEDDLKLNYFKQILIPVVDEQYFRNNFQFRFRNYASLEDRGVRGWASNVDQWHIDYVKLDRNRSHTDLYPNDVAFVAPTTSFLKNYYAMPWNQFHSGEVKEKFYNQLSNLSSSARNTSYTYLITNANGQVVTEFEKNNENAEPYYPNFLHDYLLHAHPDIDRNAFSTLSDSTVFTVTHVFEEVGMSDVCPRNDTCVFEQKFYNYYAYDDGTAEAGYSLLSTMTNPEAFLALRFTLNNPDTLRAVRIWFNNVLDNGNFEYFTLKVWAPRDTLPGTELYSSEALIPSHGNDYLDFVTYYLDEPIVVSGTFFVGFYQNHNTQLNIGFDQNSDSRVNVFFKTESQWKKSILKGVPMIRPVLGREFPTGLGIGKPENNTAITVYPNPTRDMIRINVSPQDTRVTGVLVFDMYGKMIFQENIVHETEAIDLAPYAPGIYFVRVMSGNKILGTSKVIKL